MTCSSWLQPPPPLSLSRPFHPVFPPALSGSQNWIDQEGGLSFLCRNLQAAATHISILLMCKMLVKTQLPRETTEELEPFRHPTEKVQTSPAAYTHSNCSRTQNPGLPGSPPSLFRSQPQRERTTKVKSDAGAAAAARARRVISSRVERQTRRLWQGILLSWHPGSFNPPASLSVHLLM